MSRHLTDDDQWIIKDDGTARTVRQRLKFIGASVSLADNSGQSRTDVTVTGGGGGAAASFGGRRTWLKNSLSVTTASGINTDIGSLDQSSGSQTWFDSGASSLSSGNIFFAEDGMYSISQVMYFQASATYSDVDLFSIYLRVFPETTHRYDHYAPMQITEMLTAGQAKWTATINVCDYFKAGGSVTFRQQKPVSGMTARTVYIETQIIKVAA
jgi:hypothetical protein